MELITSRQNERIKNAVKLCERGCRESAGLFRFEGARLLSEYLGCGFVPHEVYVREDCVVKYKELLRAVPDERCFAVGSDAYGKMTLESSPDGLLCVAPMPESEKTDVSAGGGILLESVRDSGNVGTILRSALAFGIKNVYVSADSADVYSQKTVKGAMGALFRLRIIRVSDVASLLESHATGRKFAAMPANGASLLGSVRITDDDIVVIGNEGNGVTERTASLCDALTIPTDARSESLNAAVAASVIMWELSRSR